MTQFNPQYEVCPTCEQSDQIMGLEKIASGNQIFYLKAVCFRCNKVLEWKSEEEEMRK